MAKRTMAPEDAWLVRTAGDPRLSADGRRAAWVETTPDRETDKPAASIMVAPADGSEPARSFTHGPRDVSPRWSPDGRWLAYVSKADDQPARLHVAPLDGGAPRAVTDLPGGASQPAWSPDSTRIAFVSSVGAPEPAKDRTPVEQAAPRVVRGLYARQDDIGWFEGRRHLFVVDVASGEVSQVTDGDWDDDMPSWSPDGETLVFASDRGRGRNDRFGRSDAWLVAASGKGRARRLTRGRGRASFPQFSPDGATVAFIGHEAGDEGWNRDPGLYTVTVDATPGGGSSADGEPRRLGTDLDRPMGYGFLPTSPYAWLPGGDVAVLVADRGSLVLARVAGDGRGRSRVVVAPGTGQVDGFSMSTDGRTVAYTYMSVTEPHEVFVVPWRARGGNGAAAAVRVSHANDEVRDTFELAPMERYTTTAPDGLEVEYFVVRPPSGGRKPAAAGAPAAPAHLEIHGGPHGFHPIGMAFAYYQALAAAGFAVLLPNPRGSAGYGQTFTEACTYDWGGADFDDLMACVDDAVGRGIADPDRLTVGGYSYGGFMTAWTVGHSKRFRAAVVGAPVIDHVSMIGTTDIPGFSRFELGGTPWDRPEEYVKRSPLTYLPDVTTPVLIHHWDGDLRCPIGQAEELYTALRLLHKDVEFVRYPGGSHISRSPSQAVDRTARIIDWVTSHTRPSGGDGRRRRRR